MACHRVLFFLAALWEVIRFVAAFNIATLIFAVNTSMVKATAIVWLGSPQLLLAAGFLFIGAMPHKKGPVLNILRLGKALELASALLLVILLRRSIVFETGFEAFFLAVAPVVIAALDLILLIVLLSYRSTSMTEQ